MTGPTRPLRRPTDAHRHPADRRPPGPPGRPSPRPRAADRLRAVTGVVAGGLAVLALALAASWVAAPRWGLPGPAPDLLAWHAGLALAVVVAQVRADRTGRSGAAAAVTGLALAVLAVLWFG